MDYEDFTKPVLTEPGVKYFLHQSLSSPCLNVLTNSEGIYLKDLQGRNIMDFHGNSVHQVGYGNPKVIKVLKVSELYSLVRPFNFNMNSQIDLLISSGIPNAIIHQF